MEIKPQAAADGIVRNIVDRLVSAYHGGRTLVLLSDYDGTLVPFVDHPPDARLAPNVRHVLERLTGQPRVRVGILSGRAIDNLKGIVGIQGLCYGGTSGLELELGSVTIIPPDAVNARGLVSRVRDLLRNGLAEQPDAWVEEKLFGITLHYRNVTPQRISRLRARVVEVLRPFENELRVLECALGIEITPEVGLTKGTAVRLIVDQLGRDSAFVFYAGNDANDADALEAAVELGGIGLGIGYRAPSAAQYHLPDSPAFTGLLVALLQHLAERSKEGG